MLNKRILMLVFVVAFLTLLVGCFPGITPSPPEGTIGGRIMAPPGPETTKDITGWIPLANATVTITDSEGVTHTVTTDEDGYYTFTDIAVDANTIITAAGTVDGNTVIIKDVIPQAVAANEDYEAGIADAESTALALIVEELLEQGVDPGDIDLGGILGSDNFNEVVEQVNSILEENGNVTTDPNLTNTVGNVAEDIINPPGPSPEPSPPPVNHAPIITSDPIETAIMGVEYIYDVEATDPDGDALTYSLDVYPFGMVIGDPGKGVISWIPTAVGEEDVTVKVSDGKLSVTQSFKITVSTVELTGIVVLPETMTLFEGESEAIQSVTATYAIKTGFEALIALEDCTYESSDEAIATVSEAGLVKAEAENLTPATITVTYAGMTDTLEVTVNPILLTSLVVLPEAMTLFVGDFEAIDSITAHYNDESDLSLGLGDCGYQSDEEGFATVVDGVITAVAPGIATITVSYQEVITEDDTVVVTVIEPVHNITQNTYFNTIQDAIDDASTSDGDTIEVAAGTYNIGFNYAYPGFTIDKEITLQGEDRDTTIIDGQLSFQTIKITANNVTITGFTFCNSRYHDIVTDTNNIQDNLILTDNIFERVIQPYSINNLEVSHNQALGIAVWNSSGIVADNTMDNILMGISVKFCDGLTVQNNTITARVGENTDDGVDVQGGSNIIVEGNTITGFTAGERTGYNNGTDGAGISISGSTNCTVSENDLVDNTLGVLVEKAGGGSEIHINNNNFEGNTEFGGLNCELWTGKDGTYTPASAIIDATYNWWGSEFGPKHDGHPELGGDAVSDNVDYEHFLTSEY